MRNFQYLWIICERFECVQNIVLFLQYTCTLFLYIYVLVFWKYSLNIYTV